VIAIEDLTLPLSFLQKHLCASISVGDSVKDPLGYYENNVSGTVTLLQAMVKHETKVSNPFVTAIFAYLALAFTTHVLTFI
jgi:UDP-glucose 4-epimerase